MKRFIILLLSLVFCYWLNSTGRKNNNMPKYTISIHNINFSEQGPIKKIMPEDTLIITKKRDNMDILIYPNPFKKNSTVNFTLSSKDVLTIKLYDVEGREKKTIIKSEKYEKGDHVVEFSRNNLEGGFYLIQLMSKSGRFAKQVILVE